MSNKVENKECECRGNCLECSVKKNMEAFLDHRAFEIWGQWVWFDSNPDGSKFLLRLSDSEIFATVVTVTDSKVIFRPHSGFKVPFRIAFYEMKFKSDMKPIMNFGQALEALKNGAFVRRAGWNGKNMYLYLVKHSVAVSADQAPVTMEPAICMFTAQGKHQIGWLASQADVLSEDWEIVTAEQLQREIQHPTNK